MFHDDEYELLVTTPERVKALGFRPQKEILTNHVLPYAEELDVESSNFLEEIKTNLAKSVMLREMKPACGIWTSRLMKYIRMYGLKFGKEDHIALIKLTYELVLIPDLEPCKVHKFATLFLMLSKKRHLISPEELTLPWRPLYEAGKRLFDNSATHVGLYHYLSPKRSGQQGGDMLDMIRKFLSGYGLDDALRLFGLAEKEPNELPTALEGSYVAMVKCAKPYFEVTATKEILAELLPQVCPWSTESNIMCHLVVFLPVSLPPSCAAQGHELWFDEMMVLWDTCHNAQNGVSELIMLFSGLAKRNPGAVNWSPHVSKLFTRFLHALNLPVSYKDMQISKSHALDMKNVASWIIWTINPDGVVLKQLRSFLSGVESYLHSANSGRWSYKLRDLIRKLAREFLNRVRREREKRFLDSWENNTPDAYKLRDEDITEFVNIMLEPTLQAVYSRSSALDISIALQNLATLRPAIVIPPLLDNLRSSLTSLTEPHRVTATMTAVVAAARPMLRGADADYPEGPTHVIPLLIEILPGIDPNDIKKTFFTLHFILIFVWMIPIIDCSSAHEHWKDLTEEELLVCESTAQLEDFVLIYLDRIFILVESSILENVRLDTKDAEGMRSKTDALVESAIASTTTAVLMQCSPKIFKEALRKFRNFATESTFEPNVSGSIVGVLLRIFARIDPESTLAAFLPQLCEELNELLSTEEALHEENPPRDLLYRLLLLVHATQCDGTVLLKYMPALLPILDRALKLHSKSAIMRACDVVSHILTSLSYVDLKEYRSSPKDYSAAPEKWLPIREWGSGCLLKDSDLKWHVPNAEEAQCAQMLVDRYMKPEVLRLRQWLSGERPMCRERRKRSFYIISAILTCGSFLPAPNEEVVELVESQIPGTNVSYANGVPYQVTLDGENMRVALTKLLLDVQARMVGDKTDDTRGLELLIQVWERVILWKNLRPGLSLDFRMRSYASLERSLDGRGGVGGDSTGAVRLRMLLAEAARLQVESRVEVVCEAGMTPSALKAMHALYELSINTYTSVRIHAQIRLCWMLAHYAYSYRALVPRLFELLSEGGEGDEWHAKHKGALYIMLGPRVGPIIHKRDWEVVKTLWPAVLKAPLSEKLSILRLEQVYSDTLHRNFPTVNTRNNMSEAAVDAASYFITEEHRNDPKFAEQLSKALERETAYSDITENYYKEFMEEIVNIAESPNVQWRRLEFAMQMLQYCPSVQTKYSARAVKLVVNSLIHDDIAVRRMAHRLTHYVLKQRKRPIKKFSLDTYELIGVPRPETHVPGYRQDLEWALWSKDKIPKTEEDWNKPWLKNSAFGFYAWPDKLKVAAPANEQVQSSDISPEDMEEGERYIYEFFTNEANVDKLVGFLTVEEKKGRDKFSGVRFAMFQSLFAQYGEKVADRFIEHAVRCAADSQEAPQRFAAEIAAAVVRAPRYWTFSRARAMHEKAARIITAGLTAVTPETMEDWGTSLATAVENLDPNRCGDILQTILQLCAPPTDAHAQTDKDASFVICARLYALQGVLGSLNWRAAPLAAEILNILEKANFINHPYQNVRETVGSILMTIFDMEVVFPGGELRGAPCLANFIESIQPKLAALYDENGDLVVKTTMSLSGNPGPAGSPCVDEGPCAKMATPTGAVPVEVASFSPDSPMSEDAAQSGENCESSSSRVPKATRFDTNKQLEHRLDAALRLAGDASPPPSQDHVNAVNLLTTVLRGCMGVTLRGVNADLVAQQALVPSACGAASRGAASPADELPRAAAGFLAALAPAPRAQTRLHAALAMLPSLAAGRSWWARLAALEFAQPLLFYALPMLCEEPERARLAEDFTLTLMRDARLEVRQTAAKLLTGLMHCRALCNEEATLSKLMRSCRSKELVERHCGILGLCAYLGSRPYGLAPKLGAVLAELSRHSGGPDPIPATIRTALADFRRTHQDDWNKHREQLSQDELDLLADLTSPPSYCA